MKTRYAAIGIFPLILALAGCAAGPEKSSTAPSGLSSSAQLRADSSIRGAYIYRAANINTAKYQRVLIDPVVVYSGPEANFGTFSQSEKTGFANTVSDEFRKVLGEKLQVTNAPAADVIRLRLTLLSVTPTSGGVATVTRVLPVGLALNAIRGAAGEGGALTGGIELAVEVLDAQTNEILVSAVRSEAPGALDIEATLSTDDTVRASARGAAEVLREGIIRRAPQMVRK